MANVNINRNQSDQFYRYKMPKLVAKVEGKGNGVKTVIVNMPEIAKSLNRPPMYPTKYFACSLGAQVIIDNKSDCYIISGAHDPNKLQDLLDGFIQKYVLCQTCKHPQTLMSVDEPKKVIRLSCTSCGYSGSIQTTNADQFVAFIVKNPPSSQQQLSDVGLVAADLKLSNDNANNEDEDDEPDDLNSDDLNEIDYGDDDDDIDDEEDEALNREDEKSGSEHNIALSDHYDDEGEDDDDDDVDDDDDDNNDGIQRHHGSGNEEDSEKAKQSGDKNVERCKYWPACNVGEKCHFYHPTKPCRNFPKCSFGDKCLYIHPPCKFNQSCARPDCPFAHPAVLTTPAAKRRPPPNHHQTVAAAALASVPIAPKCKYGFNCKNLMCKFSHQATEPCRYGSNCLLETCPFNHPTDLPRKKPASQFKWSAQS